jgi:hypothetical protein
VIVHFVDIGGVVDHDCLNFLSEKDRKRCEELQAQLAEQAKFDEERFVELLL